MSFPLGHLTLFGYTTAPDFLEHRLPDRLGISPRTIDFGRAGMFFFHSAYGDMAETDEVMAWKLGYVRSPDATPLATRDLLAQRAIRAQAIDHHSFRGNALLASFDKRQPRCLVFKTLLSALPLYYATVDRGILCATGLRALIALLDRVELDEAAVVPQFLFGSVFGPATHLRGVHRLFPGEQLRWQAGECAVEQVRDLRFTGDEPFTRADTHALDSLYTGIREVIGAYVDDIERAGGELVNQLSGGVDSSLVQLALRDHGPASPARTVSFAVRAASFERDLRYAEQGIGIFGTRHTYVDITERDFPELLVWATRRLAQPVLSQAEVCMAGLVKALSEQPDAPRHYIDTTGADSLFGLTVAQKVVLFEWLRRVPLSASLLYAAGNLLKPVWRRGRTMLNFAELLRHRDDPDYENAPLNTEVRLDLGLARRCFGDVAVRRAFVERRELEVKYLGGSNYMEQVHVVGLLGETHETALQNSLLFLSAGLEQVYPFMDEDLLRLSFAFPPRLRYIRGLRQKYLLKDALNRRVGSPITRQPKGYSSFRADFLRWLRRGSLQPLLREIAVPSWLSRADFDRWRARPDFAIWNLLAFDLFQKHALSP
jgi:asparagine synthetase B (glutamine-hydrolysing)